MNEKDLKKCCPSKHWKQCQKNRWQWHSACSKTSTIGVWHVSVSFGHWHILCRRRNPMSQLVKPMPTIIWLSLRIISLKSYLVRISVSAEWTTTTTKRRSATESICQCEDLSFLCATTMRKFFYTKLHLLLYHDHHHIPWPGDTSSLSPQMHWRLWCTIMFLSQSPPGTHFVPFWSKSMTPFLGVTHRNHSCFFFMALWWLS